MASLESCFYLDLNLNLKNCNLNKYFPQRINRKIGFSSNPGQNNFFFKKNIRHFKMTRFCLKSFLIFVQKNFSVSKKYLLLNKLHIFFWDFNASLPTANMSPSNILSQVYLWTKLLNSTQMKRKPNKRLISYLASSHLSRFFPFEIQRRH